MTDSNEYPKFIIYLIMPSYTSVAINLTLIKSIQSFYTVSRGSAE